MWLLVSPGAAFAVLVTHHVLARSGLFLLRHRVRPDSHRRPPSEKSSLKPRGWLRALTPPLMSTLS